MSINLDRKMADGVWIIKTTSGCISKSRVAKVCDLPEIPYDFASIMCTHNDLCTFMGKYEQEYAKEHNNYYPSRHEMALAILRFLAKKAGVTKNKKRNKPSRRIDLTL